MFRMLKIFLGVEHLLNIMGAATTFWGTAFGGQTTVKTGHCIPQTRHFRGENYDRPMGFWVQCEAPKIARASKPAYNWGASHCTLFSDKLILLSSGTVPKLTFESFTSRLDLNQARLAGNPQLNHAELSGRVNPLGG